MKRITRREALKLGALAGGSLILPIALERRGLAGDAGSPKTAPFTLPFKVPPVLKPVRSDNNAGSNGVQDFSGTDYYEITHKPGKQTFIPGYTTEVWGYNGTFPGPTIIVPKGRQTVVRQINNLPGDPFSVHLHGMASLPQYDGYADDLTPAGYYKDYVYPNDRAATMWYHDHTIGKTAFHVYKGLAAFDIVQDDYELSLPLPKGQYDVPLMIHDKQFDSSGAAVYDDHGETHIMGDVITVNGVAWPKMEVEPRKYRFRILNGSISRSYKLALSTGEPLIVIGTDAGLMTSPALVKDFRIGMAERYEVIIDFSKYKNGTQVVLQNLELPIDINYDNTNVIMRFDVVKPKSSVPDPALPSTLRTVKPLLESEAVRTREWRFERTNGQWVINGQVWDQNRVDANPQLGDVEIWRLFNNGGGWFHPVHIHLIDQQILDRNGAPPMPHERGWKDVFYVGPNESLRVIGKYGPHKGRYMMHCHNTVHEDFDMMTQWEVGQGGPDPVTSAPPKPISQMTPL